jgi:hypothetical protein
VYRSQLGLQGTGVLRTCRDGRREGREARPAGGCAPAVRCPPRAVGSRLDAMRGARSRAAAGPAGAARGEAGGPASPRCQAARAPQPAVRQRQSSVKTWQRRRSARRRPSGVRDRAAERLAERRPRGRPVSGQTSVGGWRSPRPSSCPPEPLVQHLLVVPEGQAQRGVGPCAALQAAVQQVRLAEAATSWPQGADAGSHR